MVWPQKTRHLLAKLRDFHSGQYGENERARPHMVISPEWLLFCCITNMFSACHSLFFIFPQAWCNEDDESRCIFIQDNRNEYNGRKVRDNLFLQPQNTTFLKNQDDARNADIKVGFPKGKTFNVELTKNIFTDFQS